MHPWREPLPQGEEPSSSYAHNMQVINGIVRGLKPTALAASSTRIAPRVVGTSLQTSPAGSVQARASALSADTSMRARLQRMLETRASSSDRNRMRP